MLDLWPFDVKIRYHWMLCLFCAGRKRVTPQARLREELGADSLAAVELCMALEEACGVVIDDALLPNLETVQDILDYWNQYTE